MPRMPAPPAGPHLVGRLPAREPWPPSLSRSVSPANAAASSRCSSSSPATKCSSSSPATKFIPWTVQCSTVRYSAVQYGTGQSVQPKTASSRRTSRNCTPHHNVQQTEARRALGLDTGTQKEILTNF
eukprot:1194797-Prorocentrum_minimum.AAC.3